MGVAGAPRSTWGFEKRQDVSSKGRVRCRGNELVGVRASSGVVVGGSKDGWWAVGLSRQKHQNYPSVLQPLSAHRSTPVVHTRRVLACDVFVVMDLDCGDGLCCKTERDVVTTLERDISDNNLTIWAECG